MSEIEKEGVSATETPETKRTSRRRFGLGALATFSLHQTLLSIGSAIGAFVVPATDYTDLKLPFHNSPSSVAWMVAWSVGTALVWRRIKPSPVEWTVSFAVLGSFWYTRFMDTPHYPGAMISLDQNVGMMGICALAGVVGLLRLGLGEGRQQKRSLQRLATRVVPDFHKSPALPQEVLLRASSQPETAHTILLRPARDTTSIAPGELLRASQSADRRYEPSETLQEPIMQIGSRGSEHSR